MTLRQLTCCVCGEDAGRWQQWWNRDDGWGICRRCVAEQSKREDPEQMKNLYGIEGVNYECPSNDVQAKGFVDASELDTMVASVNVSTPERRILLEAWRVHDGSKKGLLEIIDLCNGNGRFT